MYLRPFLAHYLFFAWFSVIPQLLFLAYGITGWAGPRDTILYSLAWLLLPALLPARALPAGLVLSGVAMALCALAKLGNFALFQQEISQSVFVAVFESDSRESTEFLQQFFQWWMIPAALAFLAPPFYLARWLLKHPLPDRTRLLFASTALLFLLQPFLAHGYQDKSLDKLERHFAAIEPWGMLQNLAKYRQNLEKASQLQANMEQALHNAQVTLLDTTAQQTLVLVIGESTSRKRLSLYGYPRPTSPRLEAIRNELLVYDNVVANIPYTIESLSATITFTDPEKLNDAYSNMNLITLMKQAGFKTYWITNQQTLSKRNTLLTAFARLSDEREFLNHNRRQNSASYDENVLEPFQQALADPAPRKMIIVHLLGAHFAYEYRYPPAFARFDQQSPVSALANDNMARELYNQYDNAVLYNDHVVRELIERYRQSDPYGVLVYFADHGEEVFDVRHYNGRNMGEPTVNMYEVPFLVWTSPSWQATHDMPALAATVQRPSELAAFLHGWCTLASIDYSGCRSERSLFGPAFVPQARWVGVGKDRQSYETLQAQAQQTQR